MMIMILHGGGMGGHFLLRSICAKKEDRLSSILGLVKVAKVLAVKCESHSMKE
jgi:hypothetical protein